MSRAFVAIPLFLLAVFTASAAPPPSARNGPIVFVGEGVSLPQQPTLLTVGADGRGLRWLGGPGAGRPVFAPRGRKLAYLGGRDIHVVSENGMNDRVVARGDGYPVWSPDGKRLAFTDYLGDVYVVGANGSGLRLVAKAGDPKVGDPASKLTWSPDGKRLAFASAFSHPGGKYRWVDRELRVVDLASGAITRLTRYSHPATYDGPWDFRPAWSPDGRFVAFLHYDTRGFGTSTVELVSLESRTITTVARPRAQRSRGDSKFIGPSDVVWAPDGQRLAFTDLDGAKVVRLRGKRIVRVGPALPDLTPCSLEDVPAPAWSPDGRRVAYLFAPTYSACNLYVVPASGGRPQAVTHLRDFSLLPDTPSWSSNGRRLAVTTYPHGDEGPAADLRILDGTRSARLTKTPDAAESDPAYSRSGQLAYARANAFFDGQVVVRLRTGAEKVVAEGREPAWAPDERHFAYVRDGALYVRAVAGGSERVVVSRTANASDPAWSPRGDVIAFVSHAAGGDTLEVVPASGGEPHVLLALPGDSCDAPHGAEQPAWSRDGQRLAVVFEVQRRCVKGSDYGTGSIVTMRPDGSDRHVVLDGSAYAPSSEADTPVGGFEPEWSPDGQQIAFTLKTPRGSDSLATVAVVPAQGGAVDRLTPGSSPAWQPIVVTASRGTR
jgi:Tol biopolymer transport system component